MGPMAVHSAAHIPSDRDAARHLLSQSLWHVVGYNWLVAATVLPIAIVLVWPLAGTRLPVSTLFCIAYTFLEVTAFCAERNWSRVGVLCFWKFAAPCCIVQTLLCSYRAYNEPLGCLFISALCVGMRETLFELFHAGKSVGGYDARERATSALIGGFAYSALLVFAFGMAFALLRVTQARTPIMSTHLVHVLYLLVFPITRALSRMFLTKMTSGLALGAIDEPAPRAAAAAAPAEAEAAEPVSSAPSATGPPLDVLVLNSDMAFVLTMFLEVPFACLLLLVPWTLTFFTVAIANAIFDVAFCCVLDVLQRRRLGMLSRTCAKDDAKIEQWSPTYLNDRPISLIATLINGGGSQGPDHSEAARLRPPLPVQLSQATSSYGGSTNQPVSPATQRTTRTGTPMGTYRSSSCFQELPTSPRRPSAWHVPGEPEFSPMSPRVSLLLDEYDDALIECRAGWARSEDDCSGLDVYLFQDRKLTFMNHLLGNTLALALAATCVPLFRLRFVSTGDLMMRVVVLVLLRMCADLAACVVLGWTTKDVRQDECLSLWGRRHEFATFHGWLLRVLVGICPVFALIVALAPWEARAEPYLTPATTSTNQKGLDIAQWGRVAFSLSRSQWVHTVFRLFPLWSSQ
mmetsp:Transcript_9209/g.17603  ORF Transcript_9209/g.17603 Transcript_9209/m.17603 type:complete len:630 (-) Transcript_9209:41-1930(-)